MNEIVAHAFWYLKKGERTCRMRDVQENAANKAIRKVKKISD
jgi:hypothetical protein